MKTVLKVLRVPAIAGMVSQPYSAAHAWGGWGPWGSGDWGSGWEPFDGDRLG